MQISILRSTRRGHGIAAAWSAVLAFGCSGPPEGEIATTWTGSALASMRQPGVPIQIVFDETASVALSARVALAGQLLASSPRIELGWIDGDRRTLHEMLAAGMRAWRTTATGVDRYVPDQPLPENDPQPIPATIELGQDGRITASTSFPGAWDLVVVTATGALATAWDDAGRQRVAELLARGPEHSPLWCRVRMREVMRGSDWVRLAR